MRAHRSVYLAAICLLGLGLADRAEAGRPPRQGARPAFPEIVGEAVGLQNHAYWPVRVQRLDRVRWTLREGQHVGMAAPSAAGLLFVQAGGGGIRGVEAGTGKRWWLGPGQMNFWNYSTCVLGPGSIAYGGNHNWIQAVDRKGKRLWRTELQCGWIHKPPAVAPDGKTVYVGGDGLGIAALDAKTGHVNWMRRDFHSPWNTYVFDEQGTLLVGTRAGLFAFGKHGKELWSLPYRWRPTVSREGFVYLGHRDQILCIGGERAPKPERVVASDLTVVADDFVVDIWVNGKKLPLDMREMVTETHGATTERIHVDLHEGDWVVFNVVANRLRWNGASYFGVHATGPEGEMAFVSEPGAAWSACDDPAAVAAFIAEAAAGVEQAAQAPANPWSGAAGLWQSLLGGPFRGQPVWGAAPNTWIKVRVGRRERTPAAAVEPDRTPEPAPQPPPNPPPPNPPPPPVAEDAPASEGTSRAWWEARLRGLEPGMAPEQVKAVLPPWPDGGGEGLAGGGSSYALIYRVSARWIARVGFTYAAGWTGLADLLDAADPEYDDTLLCHLTVMQPRGPNRWRTAAEVLVGAGGDYALTRYPERAMDAAVPHTYQGRLPQALAKRLRAAFEGDTRHYQIALEDAKAQHPDGVEALQAFLRRAHPDGA